MLRELTRINAIYNIKKWLSLKVAILKTQTLKQGLYIFSFLFLGFISKAQRSEIGLLMGTSFYLGDLNSVPFRDAEFGGGLVYRYNFSPRIALKANILFGKIKGDDSKNHSFKKDDQGIYLWDYSDRKLSFSSPISEISAQVEINFFNVYNVPHKNQISPYLFGGISLFSFNPQATFKGTTYNLRPIVTQDEVDKIWKFGNPEYKLTKLAIPFGIGFKANIGRYVSVGAEWGLRFTFTDFLDDVGGTYRDVSNEQNEIIKYFADPSGTRTAKSQRYTTKKNDWYSFAGVIITVRIGNEDRICDVKTNVKMNHKKGKKH